MWRRFYSPGPRKVAYSPMAMIATAPITLAMPSNPCCGIWTKDPQVRSISILAHSMGNWVTLEALRQMAIRDGRVAPKVKLVLLADADVDVDIAKEQIETLGAEHPHIVLFVSENDRALAASQDFWDAPRLGSINPDDERYKSIVDREGVSVINMTHMPSHDFFNHGKFAEDPQRLSNSSVAVLPRDRFSPTGVWALAPRSRKPRQAPRVRSGTPRASSSRPLSLSLIRRREIISATRSMR